MSAAIRRWRNTSSTFALRMSTWWWGMSFGPRANGRRSTPTTAVSPWRSFASARPRFPEIPVTRTDAGIPPEVGASRGASLIAPASPDEQIGRSQVDAPTLGEAALDEGADGTLDFPYLPLELRVLVVGGAGEPHRLAEAAVIAGGERQGEDARRDRERREAEQARERLQIEEGGRLLLRPDHRARDDRNAGLEREPHEPEPERLQPVALAERLVEPAYALGEDEERLARGEQAPAVLGGADDLAAASHEGRDEREGGDPPLDEGTDDARRVLLDEEPDLDHRRVEGELARVVGDDEDAPVVRDPVRAVELHAEVALVEPQQRGDGGDDVLHVEPVRIDAVLVAWRRQLLEAGARARPTELESPGPERLPERVGQPRHPRRLARHTGGQGILERAADRMVPSRESWDFRRLSVHPPATPEPRP